MGPFRTPSAYYFGRVVGTAMPPDILLGNLQFRGQLTTDILGGRQRTFLGGYPGIQREHAKVEDNQVAFDAN